jgi:uncharacterized membrane protein YccF (DUF307 family)
MHLLGNLIWIIFGGFISSVFWFISGVLCCITLIGIPFGIQCFKISSFVIWPFGRDVEIGSFGFGGLLGNFLWIIFFGWELFIAHLVMGLIFCITIIGIPFGRQHLKLAKLSLVPFGARIYTKSWI